MSYSATTEYLLAIVGRYQEASKKEKSQILNHAEMATDLSRKQLIRRLNKPVEKLKIKKRSGRPKSYNKKELLPHIRHLWIQMERISPRLMKESFVEWLPYYDQCPGYLKYQLQKMSVSTLRRFLNEIRETIETKKGIATTSPARYMKNKVPINTLDSKIHKPGFMQADTVSHCGNSPLGPFVSTLTVTDIYSTWTETRAMSSKKAKVVRQTFGNLENALPFHIKSINVDSGTEFLNEKMWNFTIKGNRITYTRSRAYQKNDNCFVEQKNYTHVRELFGYERIEEKELVDLMNEIYIEYWNPLQNFFRPTFKLKEKVRIGARIKRKYDKPKTPYRRLMESEHLTEEQKKALAERKRKLNPFKLKQGLEEKLAEFFERLRTYKTGKGKAA